MISFLMRLYTLEFQFVSVKNDPLKSLISKLQLQKNKEEKKLI